MIFVFSYLQKKDFMLQYLWHYIKKYKFSYFVGAIFVVIQTTLGSFTPKYVQEAIDLIGEKVELDVLLNYVFIIIGLALSKGFFMFLMRRIMIGASRKIENDIRNDFFEKLTKLDVNFFHNNRTGDLMARATNDLGKIRSVFGPAIMYTITLIFAFIVYFNMMISISFELTMWTTIPLPIMAIIVYFFGQKIQKKQGKIQADYSEISNYAQENLAGNRVVKSFVLEKEQIKKFQSHSQTYYEKYTDFMKLQSLFHPIIYLIIMFGVVAIFFFGGNLVVKNELTIGELTAFLLYLNMLSWPSIAVGWVAGLYQTGVASVKRINKILHAESTIKTEKTNSKIQHLEGKIEFRNLTFRYPNTEKDILSNISLTLKKGETLGIIGHVGSGKTTFINLLSRLYQVEDNQLFIDGNDMNKISPEVISGNIAVVPQETFLFSKSIRENILIGNSEASEEELFEAVRNSELTETLDLFKDGIDTLLGERGVNLSGGQKQRVAIARALIRKSPILIFDDSLSAVDTHTEEKILSSIISKTKDKTTIIVSHRISSVQHADLIICLENGKLVENGRHEELMKNDGIYAELYRKQLLEEEISELN
jgi:ATP-binding cassette subfamily B protein